MDSSGRVSNFLCNELQQRARNTKPKDLFQLFLSGNKSEFVIRNYAPIKLDRYLRYEVALVNLETNYSFHNVDASITYFDTQMMIR